MTKVIKNELIRERLIEMALAAHGEILPIGGKPEHDDRSFTEHQRGGEHWIYFWYEDASRSSHIQRLPVEN